MGIFSFRHIEKESELETALQGVFFLEELALFYNGCGKNKDEKRKFPSFFLPVINIDNTVYSLFNIAGKIAEAPIEFVHKKNFLFNNFYQLEINGGLMKKGDDKNGIFLPLVKIPHCFDVIGETKDKKFTSLEGSPFQIMGLVRGEKYPLMFVSETDEGIKMRGIYIAADGNLKTYNLCCDENKETGENIIGTFLESLRQGGNLSRKRKIIIPSAGENSSKVSVLPKIVSESKLLSKIDWEKPKTIVKHLDKYVIGQNDAKRVVAVAFSNYMTKVQTKNDELPKDNMILIGPSGVGKTYMISLLAKEASLPMVQTKLTGKSSEGYKGENLSCVFEQIRTSTSDEAPYGIVFFDEIDKLAKDDDASVFGPRLQDELIGWLEEAVVFGNNDRNSKKTITELNTKNILFVTAGAFQGLGETLDDIIRKRINQGQKKIGFAIEMDEQTEEENILHKVRPEDFIVYGLKPELIGRLPSIGILDPLSNNEKVSILTEAERSPLKKYLQLFQLKGYQLELDNAVSEIIASYCPTETGARALSAICNDLFTEILYEPEIYTNEGRVIKVTPDLARKLINLYS